MSCFVMFVYFVSNGLIWKSVVLFGSSLTKHLFGRETTGKARVCAYFVERKFD